MAKPMSRKDRFREWVSDNLRYMLLILAILVVVGLILLVVHLVSSNSDQEGAGGNAQVTATPTPAGESGQEDGQQSAGEPGQEFAAENNAQVSAVATTYFTALASKDIGTIKEAVDTLPAEDEAQITAEDLRELYHTLQERGRIAPRSGQSLGLSPATVRGIHAALHQALQAAADQGLMPNNPAKQVDPPKITHKPMKILNEEQVNIFLDATNRDPIWRDFFYTELTTGLRLGEICGLMWSDFDGRKGTLSISRTLRKEKGGRLVAGDTKTYAGTRTILLPTSTAERLRLRKKTSYSPWIFHDPLRPEAPLNPGTAYRQLKKVLQETGLPELRFHDLRHTFATHALASGVDAKTLSGILGHTKASFTLDTYTHTTGDMQRRAAEIVGGFLTDYLGEEMAPWQNAENTATAASV